MTSNDPYRKTVKNHKKSKSQGDREKTFTVIHVDKTAPEAIYIDLVSATSEAAATTAAKRQYPNCTILRVSENTDDYETSQYPDARFIKGEFLPVDRAGETS